MRKPAAKKTPRRISLARGVTPDMVGMLAPAEPAAPRERRTTRSNPARTPRASKSPSKMTVREQVMEWTRRHGLRADGRHGAVMIATRDPGSEWSEVFDTWAEAAKWLGKAQSDHRDYGGPWPWEKPLKNPGASSDLARSTRLYERFTGHEGETLGRMKVSPMPKAAACIGTCDGILYTTVRDGRTEKYIHRFAAKDKPLFCVTPDGRQLLLLGGSYDFTERGIVDRSDKSRR